MFDSSRFVLAIAFSFSGLLACSSADPNPVDVDAGPVVTDGGADAANPAVHAIDGFALAVKKGSWWEYELVYDDSYAFDTGSGADHRETIFVLSLGAPTTIDGDIAYPVTKTILSDVCSSSPGNCVAAKPGTTTAWEKWKYLSFANKRIRGSKDGKTYAVLFDANTGIWPATSTGMMGDFPSDHGTRVANADAADWKVEESNSSSDCDSVPGYGTVCGGNGMLSNSAYEVYAPAVGCIASHYSGSTSGTGGSGNNSSTTKLVASSVDGSKAMPTP